MGAPTDLVERAHAAGLVVHVWTLRADKEFLPASYRGDALEEFRRFRALGVDGVFTDFPDLGVKAFAGAAAVAVQSALSAPAGPHRRLPGLRGGWGRGGAGSAGGPVLPEAASISRSSSSSFGRPAN